MADEQRKRTFVIWNGQEISDPALLPLHLRPLLEDLDGDGIPDLAQQGPGKRPMAEGGSSVETAKVTIRQSPDAAGPTEIGLNGRTYASIDQVPDEYRALVRRAMNAVPTSPAEIKIKINGQTYASIDDAPAEYRDLLRQALKKRLSPGAAASGAPSPPLRPGKALAADPFSPTTVKPWRGGSLWWFLLAAAAMALAAYLTLHR